MQAGTSWTSRSASRKGETYFPEANQTTSQEASKEYALGGTGNYFQKKSGRESVGMKVLTRGESQAKKAKHQTKDHIGVVGTLNISEMQLKSMKSSDGLQKIRHGKGILSTDDRFFVRSDDTTQENLGAICDTAQTTSKEKSRQFN